MQMKLNSYGEQESVLNDLERNRHGVGEMNTSKEYIEMCRKAVEIQKGWKPRLGVGGDDGWT